MAPLIAVSKVGDGRIGMLAPFDSVMRIRARSSSGLAGTLDARCSWESTYELELGEPTGQYLVRVELISKNGKPLKMPGTWWSSGISVRDSRSVVREVSVDWPEINLPVGPPLPWAFAVGLEKEHSGLNLYIAEGASELLLPVPGHSARYVAVPIEQGAEVIRVEQVGGSWVLRDSSQGKQGPAVIGPLRYRSR